MFVAAVGRAVAGGEVGAGAVERAADAEAVGGLADMEQRGTEEADQQDEAEISAAHGQKRK